MSQAAQSIWVYSFNYSFKNVYPTHISPKSFLILKWLTTSGKQTAPFALIFNTEAMFFFVASIKANHVFNYGLMNARWLFSRFGRQTISQFHKCLWKLIQLKRNSRVRAIKLINEIKMSTKWSLWAAECRCSVSKWEINAHYLRSTVEFVSNQNRDDAFYTEKVTQLNYFRCCKLFP